MFSLAAGEAEVDGSATREVFRHRALGAGGKGCHTASQAHGGQRRSGHRRRLPALSRALAGRDGSDTVGALK